MNVYAAYSITAGAGAAASVLIVAVAFSNMSHISDSGMWAIAVMALAPAIAVIGVSAFITFGMFLTGRREPIRPADDIRRSDTTAVREDRYPA